MRNDAYMWELASLFEKLLKHVGSDVDLQKMVQICGVTSEVFEKRLKNVENDFEIGEKVKIFGKWLRYMDLGLSI